MSDADAETAVHSEHPKNVFIQWIAAKRHAQPEAVGEHLHRAWAYAVDAFAV